MDSCALKLFLEVDLDSAKELDGQSRICNWLYNHLLEKALGLKATYCTTQDQEVAKTLYTERGLRNLLPSIKLEKPFLKVVHSSPLKNAALRLSESIRRHQKSKKTAHLVNWPKFQSWRDKWFSLLYDEPNKGFRVDGTNLTLSLGTGQDKKRRALILSLPEASLLQGKQISTLRICCELGQYYAIFTVKKELPKTKPISKIIALDPNHKNLSYGVDTTGKAIEIGSPTWLKIYDKRLDELKSKRDRCQKQALKRKVLDEKGEPTGKHYYLPSKRWKKYNQAIMSALRKRREQTKTFTFTIAHKLYREYDCVAIGDYTPDGTGDTKKMRRAMNNRSLIGRFKEVLSWVAKKSGKTFHEFDEKGTTRTCNHCHRIVEQGIPPSLRTWQCTQCEAIHIRDENAAINGLSRTVKDLQKKSETEVSTVSGSDLVAVQQRWAWCVLPSGVFTASRGQNSEEIRSTRKLNREQDSSRSEVDDLIIYDQV
jgi:putative transposase